MESAVVKHGIWMCFVIVYGRWKRDGSRAGSESIGSDPIRHRKNEYNCEVEVLRRDDKSTHAPPDGATAPARTKSSQFAEKIVGGGAQSGLGRGG